ncbi:MAG: hypothetical protein KGN02_04490 [bacterium]|nr:hypothetical protein [bacterium]
MTTDTENNWFVGRMNQGLERVGRVHCRAMIRIFLAVLVAGSATMFAVAPASAAPLRTLNYHFEMDARGFGGTPYSDQGLVYEGSESSSYSATGTIRVDVVEAAQDGGLVVDLTEHRDRAARDLQTIRCAVYGRTQAVVCNQNLNPTPEQTVLLQYLGRYFYEPSRVDDKGHWTVKPPITNMTIQNDYTVTKTDGSILTLKVARKEDGMGLDSTTDGTVVYDAQMSVPDSIKVATSSIQSGQQGDMNVSLTLTADSLAKK